MVAQGFRGESKEQREMHDQRRSGETPLEQPRLAWTGPPQRRYHCAKREDWLWQRRRDVERSLGCRLEQFCEQQCLKQLEDLRSCHLEQCLRQREDRRSCHLEQCCSAER